MKARADFRPFRPGLSWKNGKLYTFSKNDVMVLAHWPNLQAWRRTKALHWHRVRPSVSIHGGGGLVPFRESRLSYKSTYWLDLPNPPFKGHELYLQAVREPKFVELLQRLGLLTNAQDSVRNGTAAVESVRLRQDPEQDPFNHFWEPVPADIRSRIARFPSHHWHLA